MTNEDTTLMPVAMKVARLLGQNCQTFEYKGVSYTKATAMKLLIMAKNADDKEDLRSALIAAINNNGGEPKSEPDFKPYDGGDDSTSAENLIENAMWLANSAIMGKPLKTGRKIIDINNEIKRRIKESNPFPPGHRWSKADERRFPIPSQRSLELELTTAEERAEIRLRIAEAKWEMEKIRATYRPDNNDGKMGPGTTW